MRNFSNDRVGDKRRHYIAEWAEKAGRSQADIVRATGADKGSVSGWFNKDTIPSERYLKPLADFLGAPEVLSLFRHPDDDWLAKMFRDKTDEQRDAAVQMLKIFFDSIQSKSEVSGGRKSG